MTVQILVAFDDSENAMRAVECVSRAFAPSTAVTLFHVSLDSEALCNLNSPELTPYFRSQQSTFCTMEDKKRDLVQSAMQKAVSVLTSVGFSEKQIQSRVRRQKKSVAKDILDEARSGYDMVVMGRKGISSLGDYFMGSTSQKVLNGAEGLSVLIVR